MKLDGSKKSIFKLLESIDDSFKGNLDEISPEYVAKKTMTGYAGNGNEKNIDNGRVNNALKKSIDAALKNIYGTPITDLYVITNAEPTADSNGSVYVEVDLQLKPNYIDKKLGDDEKSKLKEYIKGGIIIFVTYDNRYDNGEKVNGRIDTSKPYLVEIFINENFNNIIKHFGDRSDLGKIRQIVRKLLPNYNINLNDIPIEVTNSNQTLQQKFDSFKKPKEEY